MYNYPMPAVTVDVVLFRESGEELEVLLIERGKEPFLGQLAFPGGHVEPTETVEQAAVRELLEETGIALTVDELMLVGVFSKPGRDPRGWYISISFLAVIDKDVEIKAGDDAAKVGWHQLKNPMYHFDVANKLAFDHAEMLEKAIWEYRD